MKRILLLSAIASVFTIVALGQDQKPQEQPKADQKTEAAKPKDQKADQAKQAQDMENMMKTELKLTDEQAAKFSAIAKDFHEKKDEITKDASLSDDARKEKISALKKEKEGKILEILTPEQQAKFKQMMEDMDKKKDAQKQKG